jgi:predicted  nucleic acid-binding Zn-ribbon protein
MDFRDYARTEASALADRLAAAAEASAEQIRHAADEALDALGVEADDLRAQTAALRAEAEGLRTEAGDLRADAENLRSQSDGLRTEADRLRVEAETRANESRELRAQLELAAARAEALDAEVGVLKQAHGQAEDECLATAGVLASTQAELRDIRNQLDAAQRHRQGDSEQTVELQRRLHDSEATLGLFRAQLQDANAMTDAVHQGLAVMRARSQRVKTLLRDSVRALDALGPGATAADVSRTLVRLLAVEFPRVAIFRLKGRHLEGELSAGVDASIDITKLVIPVGMDSVISRAAAGATLEQATAEQIAESRPPFGGTPASAVAAPLVFQGETLGVVYADSDDAPNDAHAAFAGVLVAHANVLLSRLTQELKTAKALREYAQMLLREAEQMYLADIQEGRAEADRLRRLHDTIEFGRQLFDQRAELEGGIAAGLLEDEIAALIRAEPVTPFGSGLAAALSESPARRTAS